jgi:hypothetical protein
VRVRERESERQNIISEQHQSLCCSLLPSSKTRFPTPASTIENRRIASLDKDRSCFRFLYTSPAPSTHICKYTLHTTHSTNILFVETNKVCMYCIFCKHPIRRTNQVCTTHSTKILFAETNQVCTKTKPQTNIKTSGQLIFLSFSRICSKTNSRRQRRTTIDHDV